MSSAQTMFRKFIKEPGLCMAPGAFDCISAKVIEKSGFPAVYVTGAGVASSRLGLPDLGFTTMQDVLDVAQHIVSCVRIPVICDADTGYGNALNMVRTTKEFERAGVAALQIEDQSSPKKCGHLEGKQLVSIDEMLSKIRAFYYARESADFTLIARTDAITAVGFDEAITRAKAYYEEGADIIFVESPRSVEEIVEIPKRLPGVPLLINLVDGKGKTPILPSSELEKLGYKIAIYPATAWMSALYGMERALKTLKEEGSAVSHYGEMANFQEIFELVDISNFQNLEKYLLTPLSRSPSKPPKDKI